MRRRRAKQWGGAPASAAAGAALSQKPGVQATAEADASTNGRSRFAFSAPDPAQRNLCELFGARSGVAGAVSTSLGEASSAHASATASVQASRGAASPALASSRLKRRRPSRRGFGAVSSTAVVSASRARRRRSRSRGVAASGRWRSLRFARREWRKQFEQDWVEELALGLAVRHLWVVRRDDELARKKDHGLTPKEEAAALDATAFLTSFNPCEDLPV